MPLVMAEVAEPPDIELPRLLQQPRFVELPRMPSLDVSRGLGRDQSQVGESNLAAAHGLGALQHIAHPFADLHARGRRPTRHVAVLAQPMDGGVRARGVVMVGGSESGGHLRESHLEQVHAAPKLAHVLAELLASQPHG